MSQLASLWCSMKRVNSFIINNRYHQLGDMPLKDDLETSGFGDYEWLHINEIIWCVKSSRNTQTSTGVTFMRNWKLCVCHVNTCYTDKYPLKYIVGFDNNTPVRVWCRESMTSYEATMILVAHIYVYPCIRLNAWRIKSPYMVNVIINSHRVSAVSCLNRPE